MRSCTVVVIVIFCCPLSVSSWGNPCGWQDVRNQLLSVYVFLFPLSTVKSGVGVGGGWVVNQHDIYVRVIKKKIWVTFLRLSFSFPGDCDRPKWTLWTQSKRWLRNSRWYPWKRQKVLQSTHEVLNQLTKDPKASPSFRPTTVSMQTHGKWCNSKYYGWLCANETNRRSIGIGLGTSHGSHDHRHWCHAWAILVYLS